MACMKDKDAWFIVECLTCPKVMDCIKLDWTDDSKVKEGIVSYLRELYGIDDRFPFLKDSEEKLTILNFGEEEKTKYGTIKLLDYDGNSVDWLVMLPGKEIEYDD